MGSQSERTETVFAATFRSAHPRPLVLCSLVAVLTINVAGGGKAQELAGSDAGDPYIVFVASPKAYARCGPGKEFYETERLRVGQELEVYVEAGEQWLGIRPTANSFCWIPADDVELGNDATTGTIARDETIAFIGTQLGRTDRPRWQVQLNAGEPITVIEKSSSQNKSGQQTWLKIVPPSGEFRWVHRSDVVETAVDLATKVAQTGKATERAGQNSVAESKPASTNIATEIEQVGLDVQSANSLSLTQSTRRGSSAAPLEQTPSVPRLRPAPSIGASSDADESTSETSKPRPRPTVADKAIQILRNANTDDYQDRGAVIGSGLVEEWKQELVTPPADVQTVSAEEEEEEEEGRSILQDEEIDPVPPSGAAAAASAIAEPIRRVTDVVANFISPPRLVEIGPNRTNAFTPTPSDRRWQVGMTERPRSLPQTPLAPTALTPQSPSSLPKFSKAPVLKTRIVPISAISRVQDAVQNANVDVANQILSRLMADGASADELDPLVRRIESLQASGDVNQANRTRDLLQRATSYRNLAARRDGKTEIRSNERPVALAAGTAPVQPESTTETNVNPPSGLGVPVTSAEIQFSQPEMPAAPARPAAGTAEGVLVQVYSSRPNSPPYALTDDAGLTVAYVTPYPGVNLRNHLNSRVSVQGKEKLIQGMSTPHLLVDRVLRR